MAIKIVKRVPLDYLGKGYEEAFLEFGAIAMRDYEELIKKSQEYADKPQESIKFVQKVLQERFVGGKFPQEGELKDVSKDDLLDFDAEVFLRSFQTLVGQADPKD